jgi:hypothetical protein
MWMTLFAIALAAFVSLNAAAFLLARREDERLDA